MTKRILAATIIFLAAVPALAQEWTVSTVLGTGPDDMITALAAGPDGAVWAALENDNRIFFFNGSSWTLHTTLTDAGEWFLDEAFALSANRVWMAGGFDIGDDPIKGVLLCFDGTDWLIQTLPSSWSSSISLYATDDSGSVSLWAATYAPAGFYQSSNNGADWSPITELPAGNYFGGIAGTGPDNIWVSGAAGINPCLYRYNGNEEALYVSSYTLEDQSTAITVTGGGVPVCAFEDSAGSTVVKYEIEGSGWDTLGSMGGDIPYCITSHPLTDEIWLGTENSGGGGNIYYFDGTEWRLQASLPTGIAALDGSCPGTVWAAARGTVYRRGSFSRKPWRTDYDGDGTSDIAIFRPDSGLWAVRGLTRVYFGSFGDIPVPGDYRGDGTTAPAIFRPASGLWAVRGVTRTYFGSTNDVPRPGDYTGDGTTVPAIFRSASGLWAVRGATRVYFGTSGDIPVPGYYRGGRADPAIFRYSTGLWAVKGVTRVYFGGSADDPAPGDYAGTGNWVPAVFRPGTGLWAARGVTRTYFGTAGDQAHPGGYAGDGADQVGIFRPTTGLWAVKGFTRVYFGTSGDLTVSR